MDVIAVLISGKRHILAVGKSPETVHQKHLRWKGVWSPGTPELTSFMKPFSGPKSFSLSSPPPTPISGTIFGLKGKQTNNIIYVHFITVYGKIFRVCDWGEVCVGGLDGILHNLCLV